MNAHSRAVLVSLPRVQLPHTVVSVPGPGPSEPKVQTPSSVLELKPVPSTLDSTTGTPSPVVPISREAGDNLSDQDDDDVDPTAAGAHDPYSNLEGAFGNYLADEPRPMTGGRHNDDDLLF